MQKFCFSEICFTEDSVILNCLGIYFSWLVVVRGGLVVRGF